MTFFELTNLKYFEGFRKSRFENHIHFCLQTRAAHALRLDQCLHACVTEEFRWTVLRDMPAVGDKSRLQDVIFIFIKHYYGQNIRI
jgi:hypothetical protein